MNINDTKDLFIMLALLILMVAVGAFIGGRMEKEKVQRCYKYSFR